MIQIKRLSRPTKRSGFALEQGETTEVRGLTIVNRNAFTVYVDKVSPKPRKRK